jgi:hypothetical protein
MTDCEGGWIEKPSTDVTELGCESLIKAEAFIVVSKCLAGISSG